MDTPADTDLSRSPSPEQVAVGDDSSLSLLEAYGESDDVAGSGRDSSGPDEAVFDDDPADDARSSPGTSHHSDGDDEVSELPPDSRRTSCEPLTPALDDEAPATPQKQRSPFRNPSSVRAMQLDTTPPHLMSGSRYQKYRMSLAGSRNSTPRSARSLQSPRPGGGRSSPTKNTRKEYPLVLLHVSLLPVAPPCSAAAMESVLPSHTVQNWTLLQEKVTQTVLERGILIPHPREDYDLLEERLLESLELKAPRILSCGHFHLSPEEEAEIAASEDEYDSGEDDEDFERCEDCGRRVRDGRFGAGAGNQRWSIKVYASNGLMRAGAWGAAWQEMERVDVEVLPWMDDRMKRELDLRREEELARAAMRSSPPPLMDDQRRREIYGEEAAGFTPQQPLFEGEEDRHQHQRMPAQRKHGEVPLAELLWSYVQHLLQDRRNVAIALLSVAVMFFAMSSAPALQQPPPQLWPQADVVPQAITQSEPLKAFAPSSISQAITKDSEAVQTAEIKADPIFVSAAAAQIEPASSSVVEVKSYAAAVPTMEIKPDEPVVPIVEAKMEKLEVKLEAVGEEDEMDSRPLVLAV